MIKINSICWQVLNSRIIPNYHAYRVGNSVMMRSLIISGIASIT